MRFNKSIPFILVLALLMIAIPLQANAENNLTIYTVNYPLFYFAERIGGEHVQVVFPASGDEDPAFWTPSIDTVRQYQKADLIFLNGAGYAKWTRKVSLPMLRIVDTSNSFKDKLIHIETNVTHSHGPGGDHSHGSAAFTTWLDFSQAVRQAKTIEKALSRKMPEQSNLFRKNYAALEKDLSALDQEMKWVIASKREKLLLTSHPVYDYLQRRYSLNLKNVHWEPDSEISFKQWNELKDVLLDHPAKWMIWEEDPMKKAVEKLQESGINSLVFDPCGNRPDKGDFLTVMQANIENLRRAYK